MHFRCVRRCQRTKDEVLLTSVFVCVYKTIKHSWGWLRQASGSAYRTKWWGNQGTVTQTKVVNTEALNKSRIFNNWEGEEGTDRKGISEKTTAWKKQRQESQCWCVQAQTCTQEAQQNAGEVSPATPHLCSLRENLSESSWYYFKHKGFQNTFKISWKLVLKTGGGIGLGKEIQHRLKWETQHFYFEAHMFLMKWRPWTEQRFVSTRAAYSSAVRGTGCHCPGSTGRHTHRSEHVTCTNSLNPYSTPLKEALLLSLLWERKQGSAKSNDLPQWSWDLKLCGLAPKSLCLSPRLFLLKQGFLRRSLRAEGMSSSQEEAGSLRSC